MNKIKITVLVFLFTQKIINAQIAPGMWHGELTLHDTLTLPFNFEVENNIATIFNAEEKIPSPITELKNDSILIRLPDFDAEIHAKYQNENLSGFFYNLSRTEKNKIPFHAQNNTGCIMHYQKA